MDDLFYSAGDLVVADFNGDDALDIVRQPSVDILLGNGDGTFELGSLARFFTTVNPAVADVNNDGRLDLVGTNIIMLGNGDGTFELRDGFVLPGQFPTGYSGIDPRPQYPTSVAAADLNDDGMVDLAVTAFTTYDVFEYYDEYGNPVFTSVYHDYVNALLGNGDGTFTTSWIEQHSSSSVAIGDLNNDGNLDVVTAGNGVGILLGNGDGSFQPGQHFGIASAQEVHLADFNGDGALDVATIDPSVPYSGGNDALIYLGNGDGTLQAARHNAPGFNMAVDDFNRDGALDLVTTWGTYNEDGYITHNGVMIQLGRGDGSFADGQPFLVGSSEMVGQVVTGDFNGDGFADVAINGYLGSDHFVKVMLNDGDWAFPPPPPPPPPPSINIIDITQNNFGTLVTEGHTGTRTAVFGVNLSAASTQPVTVHFSTADGTAVAGSDYQAVSGTLTFAPGETSKSISVLVNGDRVVEWDETFFVNLTGATNATIADGEGLGIIKDDEPRISISDVSKKEGKKNQTTQFIFTVTLSVAYDQPVTMSFRTINGTAMTGDSDYIAKSGTLTFKPGETTKTITIDVKGDSKKEADETFYLDLSGNSSNSLFTKKRGIGTILNDD